MKLLLALKSRPQTHQIPFRHLYFFKSNLFLALGSLSLSLVDDSFFSDKKSWSTTTQLKYWTR
jgi:hypothetical protein